MNKKRNLLWLLFLFPGNPIVAQEECRVIEDDQERLACFDTAFGVSETLVSEDKSDSGKWLKREDVSQLTDDKNIFLSLQSENEIPGRFGGAGPATLFVRCMENTTALFIDFNGQFMSDHQGGGRVQYRIDEEEMATVNMGVSNDNSALGLWNGGRSIPFVKKLLQHSNLVIRATPFSESAITATFDIRGIDNAVAELRATCSW